MLAILFVALALCALVFTATWAFEVVSTHKASMPSVRDCLIGLLTLFFDTLGIGAFATTTAFFKLWHLVSDEDIPGTLNIGIALPSVVEAFIYMSIVDVNIKTLVLMIIAATVGSWFGAGIVSRWPRRKIQVGMGITLLVTAGFLLTSQLHLLPVGGDLLALTGWKLVVAVLANVLLGALMTLGIGFLCPLHDGYLSPRYEPARRLPHHDGIGRLPRYSGQHSFRQLAPVPLEVGDWNDARWYSRCSARGLSGSFASPFLAALDGFHRHDLHRHDDAWILIQGTPIRTPAIGAPPGSAGLNRGNHARQVQTARSRS
jgi:hypothetical protein